MTGHLSNQLFLILGKTPMKHTVSEIDFEPYLQREKHI